MRATGNARWTGAFEVDELGRWTYTVVAWVDRFASWRDELRRKVAGGQTASTRELAEGWELLGGGLTSVEEALATDDKDRSEVTTLAPALGVDVDPVLG